MSFLEFKKEYKNLKTDLERKEYINNRINMLISNQEEKRIGIKLCGSYNGFITPNMGVVSNASGFFEDLILDDLNVYEEFMNYINNDIDKYMSGEPITINVIQYFIWSYFGFECGNLFQRMDIYSNGKPLSIKELKGKNIAACSERSALVQNLLQFLGFNSEIVFGKLNNDSHAYIIFKPEKNNFRILYDPMNPVEYTIDNEKKYCAGVSLMSEEEYMGLKNGETYSFNYDLVKRLFIKNNEYTEYDMKYTSDEVLFKDIIEENQNEIKR